MNASLSMTDLSTDGVLLLQEQDVYTQIKSSSPESEVVAIIPARGGSKGIHKKNIRHICGKPLIAYSIEVALRARLIDRVVVSTDSEEIAEVARHYGAEVPFLRPKNIAGDKSPMLDTIRHAVHTLYGGENPGLCMAILYPTSPFRTPSLVDFLVGKLLGGCHEVHTVKKIPVTGQEYFTANGERTGFLPRLGEKNRPLNSQFYYRPYGVFVGCGPDPGKNHYVHVLKDKISLVDIDTLEDLLLAEAIIRDKLFDFGLD